MSISITQEDKNAISLTLQIKRGQNPTLDDMKDLTFNDILLEDGTLVKDTTFEQLADASLTLESKNSLSLSMETKT